MKKLFLIGAGKMASAIAGGLVRSQTFAADEIGAVDVDAAAAAAFSKNTGVGCAVGRVPLDGEAVLIAVKPQMLAEALAGRTAEFAGKLVISIVAGVSISRIRELTGAERVIRVMPNTPALVGCGASGYAASDGAAEEDCALAAKILDAVGISMRLPERELDAVTGLSGSGPAYVFEVISARADGGVADGLPRAAALRLAAQTVAGAAKMVLDSGTHPAVLKDMVTSPGGTTARALEVLAERGFSGTVIKAVRAATARSAELGKKS